MSQELDGRGDDRDNRGFTAKERKDEKNEDKDTVAIHDCLKLVG